MDRDTADSSESHSLSLSADIFTALGQDYEIVLGGTFGADITFEGRHLDDAQAGAGDLIEVMFLSSSATDELEACLPDWERVFNIVPAPSDLLDPRGPEKRRDRILTELKKVGGLSKPYFIQLAASMGYTVTITDNIEEFRPFMTGWGRAGDRGSIDMK